MRRWCDSVDESGRWRTKPLIGKMKNLGDSSFWIEYWSVQVQKSPDFNVVECCLVEVELNKQANANYGGSSQLALGESGDRVNRDARRLHGQTSFAMVGPMSEDAQQYVKGGCSVLLC